MKGEEIPSVLDKQAVFQDLLSQGTVRAVVMPIHNGITGLPDVKQPFDGQSLGLDYDYSFMSPVPINIHCDETGVRATLSFGGVPRATFVPWDALLAVMSDVAQIAWPYKESLKTEEKPPETRRLRSVD